jgi:hypothetical protein
MMCAVPALADTGTWNSVALGSDIAFVSNAASAQAVTDVNGKPMTIVYLENLGFQKLGQNTNAEDVAWLRAQGYQVIELDYSGNKKAVSPNLNQDISAINTALKCGSFCNITCSEYRSYILMEGYRIARDVAYYLDDPTVYNFPDVYRDSSGDSLYLDLVYPANPSVEVPVLVTFSYSNSFATNEGGKLTAKNKHKRMYLPYYWGGFNDTFVEGASAVGFAWAVCDHPKYCDWGQGKYTGGANKSLGAIEVNPDASRKVKSAIRTVRGLGKSLGLNGQVAVTGFSRGSTAASLAVGDKSVADLEEASRGRFANEDSHVSCALLGPGVFDYARMAETSREYKNMKAYVSANPTFGWEMQSALYTIGTKASAPCLFFYNSDDDANYKTCAEAMKALLDSLGVETEVIRDYGSGHSVPQSSAHLKQMYDFLLQHTSQKTGTSVLDCPTDKVEECFDLEGRKIASEPSKWAINSRKRLIKQN